MKYMTMIPIKFTNKELQINDVFSLKNEDAIRPLLEKGKVRPLSKVFEERFNELSDKLSQYALTADEIKAQRPELYKQIQKAISSMDSAWLKEDLETFLRAVRTIEELYFKALHEILDW
jgi:seryl-tRNA synthetase